MNTIPRDISNIVVMGNWGAGKTQFIIRLREYLLKEKGIKTVHLDSDRLGFEYAVRKDTRDCQLQSDGSIIGPHSILVKESAMPGYMEFRVLEGSPFNQVHRDMLADLKDTPSGEVKVVEYAIGNTTSIEKGEPLDQSAHFVLESLIASGTLENTLVIQLEASFETRRDRQIGRGDKTDQEAFNIYGQPGGLMSPLDSKRMGTHLIPVKNDGVSLDNLVESIYFDFIRGRLRKDENMVGVEGRPATINDRSRR